MLGLRPVGSAPLSTVLIWSLPGEPGQQGIESVLRYASQSFTTRGGDTPAHHSIPGRIKRGFTIGRRIRPGRDGQFGSVIEASYGELELDNTDGGLNEIVDSLFADGREVTVKTGYVGLHADGHEEVNPFSTFEIGYRAIAGDWSAEHDVVKLRLVDIYEVLKNRLQQQVYAGTGGTNGTADMAGMTRPTAFGINKNVRGQLVDPFLQTIQFHAGQMNTFDVVYERGAVLPSSVDYATYAELTGASIPAGAYATCVAEGYARFGGVVELSAVTADIKGHIDQVSGSYVTTHGSVLRMVLRDYAGFISAQLDTDSFTTLQLIQTGAMGRFYPAGDQSTIEEVIEEIAGSCGAVAGEDGSGLYRVFRLEPPLSSADWSITDRNVVDIDRERLPYRVPWQSWGVSFKRNWTVQTSGDLATNPNNPSQSRRQFLQLEKRHSYVQDTNIALAHRTSSGIVVDSLFDSEASATAEAQRRIQLYSLGRALYRVTVKGMLFNTRIGQTVQLRYPRWNLNAGRRFVIVGLDDDADDENTILILFG